MICKDNFTIIKKVANFGYKIFINKIYWNEENIKFEISKNVYRNFIWYLLIYCNVAGRLCCGGLILLNLMTKKLELTEKVLGWMIFGLILTLLYAETLITLLFNEAFGLIGETIKLKKKIRLQITLQDSGVRRSSIIKDSRYIAEILFLITIFGSISTPSVVRKIFFDFPNIIQPISFLNKLPAILFWGISWICGSAIFFDLYHCSLIISTVLTVFISILEGVKNVQEVGYSAQTSGLIPFNKIGTIYRELQVLCCNGTKLVYYQLPILVAGGILLTISVAYTTVKHGSDIPFGLALFFVVYLVSVGIISNRAGAVGSHLIKHSKEFRKTNIFCVNVFKYEIVFRRSCNKLFVPIGSLLEVNFESVKFIIIDIIVGATISLLIAY